jgi:tetratricopeptide (TPR) repeat protein
MMRRAKDHQKYLSVDSFKIVGFDARLTPITLQCVLDEYFDKFSSESADLSASVWAWEHREATNLPSPSVRCLAGIRLCIKGAKAAASDNILPDAIETAREAVGIATQHQDDNIKEFALFTLASRLAEKANPEDIRESLNIFQDLACNASTASRKYLYWASQGKLLRSTGQERDAKDASELFLKMYEESERSELGGPAYRFSHWPRSVWLNSLESIARPDSGDRQQFPRKQLAREFSNKITESAPGPRDQGHAFETACGQAFLGRILTQQCRYDKAIKELNACVSILMHTTNGFGYMMKVDAIISLGDIYRRCGRENQSVDFYLEAIKAVNGLARNPDAILRQFGRDSTRDAAFSLTKVYQAQRNREGIVFAANTFLEASNTCRAPTHEGIIRHQSVHALAAWAKGLGSEPSEATKSTVDEVCGHLDEVLSDAAALEHQRAVFDTDTGKSKTISWPRNGSNNTIASPRAVDDSDMKSGLTTFHTHILKAHHLAEHGFSTRSIESLQASRASLDAYSSLNPQKLPMYFILVWVTLSNLRHEPGVDDTASVIRDTIAWTCIQARKFMGDDAETRAVVRNGVMRRGKNLVDHLPADEPYMEGLCEEYLEQKRKESQVSSAPQAVPIAPIEAPKRSVRAAVKGFLRRHSQIQQASGSSGVKAGAK